MPSDIYKKPRYFFEIKLPLVREVDPDWWFHIRRFTLGYFGPSCAKNDSWSLVFFGWVLCEWKKHEWHDQSDKERADLYMTEWSKCEKELRGLRLLQMGDECPDPELRKLLRDSLGVDLDEGRLL